MAAALPAIGAALAELPTGQAGIRLHGIPAIRQLLSPRGPVGGLAATILGPACQPVRALLFDKSAAANWSLPWHQDRTIAVAERLEVAGFGPWSMKAGMPHVAPPPALLARMITLRVHLDPVPRSNAPLLVAPGSHRMGRIAERDIAEVVARCGTAACLAEAGDVWAYSTPILHASEAASALTRRRVLRVDYAIDALPGGLRWLGV